ncbi:antitoxin Xre/MbcA/ParS toxin-binding domain-containing protein [Xanthomonas sp. NCPPB 2632]|uniref:antitoxin Xre/MbcA/ParS toxin-binding domain-containing protein n=1 Tax=Xanthomonas sp. NCPPB 2632 TaxID=3240912 RepID=UPI003518DDA2
MASPRRRKRVSPVYAELACATPLERIEMIRRGLPPSLILELACDLRLSEDNLMVYLGLVRAGVRQKLVDEERLTPQESDRVMALALLLGDTLRGHDAAIEVSADAQMAAAAWLGKWLRSPHTELEHRAPLQFMDIAHGRALVASLLVRARGARRPV